MKNLVCFLFCLLIGFSAYALSITDPSPVRASDIKFQINRTGCQVSLDELLRMSVKEFEDANSKKLSFLEKLSFKITRNHLRNNILPDGTISSRHLKKWTKQIDGKQGFHLGGFILGLTGLIGIILVYALEDEKRKNRIKWAWIGFGTGMLIAIIYISSIFQ
jgi:hypothetical protein